MANRNRLKRDAPVRRGPIRNKVISATPDASDAPRTSGTGYTVGAIVDEGVKTAMRAVEVADATVRGAVERGVDTAYMVIEEYMLRGRQAAGRNHERRNGRNEMNEERQNGGGYGNGYSGGGYGGGPWGPLNPMMAPWMQMMRMWTESMSAFIPGGTGMATDWMNQFMPGGYASGGAPPARSSVSVHVSSPHPVEVKTDIDAGAECSTLTADPLRASGGKGASLHASIVCSPGHVRISLTVPSNQPSGRYAGAVHDANGVKRGEIIVEVEAARGTASRASAGKRSRKTRPVEEAGA